MGPKTPLQATTKAKTPKSEAPKTPRSTPKAAKTPVTPKEKVCLLCLDDLSKLECGLTKIGGGVTCSKLKGGFQCTYLQAAAKSLHTPKEGCAALKKTKTPPPLKVF